MFNTAGWVVEGVGKAGEARPRRHGQRGSGRDDGAEDRWRARVRMG
jgi:hypothetical protein